MSEVKSADETDATRSVDCGGTAGEEKGRKGRERNPFARSLEAPLPPLSPVSHALRFEFEVRELTFRDERHVGPWQLEQQRSRVWREASSEEHCFWVRKLDQNLQPARLSTKERERVSRGASFSSVLTHFYETPVSAAGLCETRAIQHWDFQNLPTGRARSLARRRLATEGE